MTITVKNKTYHGWIAGILKNKNGQFEPIKKLTNFSFDEFAFYKNGKLMEVK